MENKKVIRYAEYLFSGIFFAGIFGFYAFFYNCHLHFQEQFQLFLLTGDFFISKLACPGGFSGYAGGFLTQFYYLPFAGPAIITILLFALRMVMKRILLKVNPDPLMFPVSFIPSLLAGMILCNEFYPLSAVTGFLISMAAGLAYVNITHDRSRLITGLILIPLTYWLAGGSYISLIMLMLVYELLLYLRSGKKIHEIKKGESRKEPAGFPRHLKTWYLIAYLLSGAVIPLLVWHFLILQPVFTAYMSEFYYKILSTPPSTVLVLFALPPLLMKFVYFVPVKEKYLKIALPVQLAVLLFLCLAGFRSFANFDAERIMTYDYLVRNEKWDDVLKYAERNPPGNYLSLAMLNLTLAKKGELGNKMFTYDQHGINGLFLPFNKEYVAPLMGNEIFYHLGLTNASQEYAFESMETIPDRSKSARIIKRLAETNLINGQYKVSEKYLNLLSKTLFYRKWAKTTMAYLYNEEKINSNPDWGEKRKFMVRNDYFFHVQNIEAVLVRMVKEHPDNKMAFEYLMAFYLINKDLRNFHSYLSVMENMKYKEIPVSYQEAVLFIIGSNNQDPFTLAPRYISQNTKLRMKAYADIYNAYPDARERLEKRFSGTYWYYLHFKDLENNQ